MKIEIKQDDRIIVREVAKQQLEYANTETNKKRMEEWYQHNSLFGEKPLVHLEMWTFSQEILPAYLKCKGDFAREVETKLYCNFLNQKLLDDDRVTPDCYELNYDTYFRLFDIPIDVEYTKNSSDNGSVGRRFIPKVKDLEEDYDKLKNTVFGVDMETTLCKKKVIDEAIGDILPVKLQMDCLYSVPTQMIVHFMSLQDMMFNLYDYPELFKIMMDRIADDTSAYYRLLEEKRLILPTVRHESLGQGTWCYNRELPDWTEYEKRPFTTKDVWGFMDSQETVGISPEMYEEFIFPCYQKISSQYGLLSYGCCEPVDTIWDRCISKLKNLRKVSISPWCKEEFMGERLQGTKVIYHRKPSPNYLGIGSALDEDAVRKHIRKSLLAARGCNMEITQRDVYTINHDIQKAHRYVEIIREEIESYWK
ncbi:MAG: hypothetical protein WCD89_05795 [Anaerocolumna sp.]